MREYGTFSMKASMEDPLLNAESVLRKLGGRVYSVRSQDFLGTLELDWSAISVIAFGEIEPVKITSSPSNDRGHEED